VELRGESVEDRSRHRGDNRSEPVADIFFPNMKTQNVNPKSRDVLHESHLNMTVVVDTEHAMSILSHIL